MKKLSILLFSALALVFASCQDEHITADPQANPQESLESFEGLTVEAGTDISAPLDLAQAAEMISVVNTAASPVLEEGQKIDYVTYMASKEDFSDAVALPTVEGQVATADVNAKFREFIGKSPAAKDMFFKFAAYIVSGDTKVRFGGADVYFAQTKVAVTPIPLDFVIEEGYYLIGDHCAWDMAAVVPFEHSSKDVYDDPVFTVVVTTTKADSYWKILPKSAVDASSWDGQIGVEVDGDTAAEGKLTDENANAGKIEKAATYSFTINMMDGTYSYKEVQPYIYLVGAPQGWDPANTACVLETKDFDNVYTGVVTLASGASNFFRFTSAMGDWDTVNANNLGSSENDENIELAAVDGVYSGSLVAGGPGNFCVPVDGEYKITVNLTAMTVKIQLASEPVYIYTVGNINGWTTDGEADGAKAGALASATDNGIYTGTLDLPDSGDGNSFFRFYKDLVNDWANGTVGTASGSDEVVEFDADGTALTEIVLGNEGAFKVPAGKYEFLVDTNDNILVLTKVVE